MKPALLRRKIILLFTLGLLLLASCSPFAQSQETLNSGKSLVSNPSFITTGIFYEQPVDPNGTILLSAWLDPDGSDFDEYVWDDFTLQADGTITQIDWYGLYDPVKFGKGGPVLDFRVSIYPSIPAGTEPAVAGSPLAEYYTGGNAGEFPIGTIGNAALYSYTFTLPAPLTVSAGVKYWVQIEASQQGLLPDWCWASGGNGNHYWRGRGAGGDIMYRSMPGDAAFTLWGPVADTATPTDTPTDLPTDIATSIPTDTATATQTFTATLTGTSTNTPTDTPIALPTDTATATPMDTATLPPTATDVTTSTPSYTATVPPTPTDTLTPTSTSTPLSSTPGKVTGGGTIGSNKDTLKATFGFVLQFGQGDAYPQGNLTYQDHISGLRLKAISFDLLVIEGDHAWLTGRGELDDGQVVDFTAEVIDSGTPDSFFVRIPAWNDYSAGGPLTGGNVVIHR